ncbi:MAG: 3-deoxy-8-phosphooctulonate synthase [Deltaproteobacteria bacterium]|jgi:2-dehydro-3-deoxyphosphooctonate aldolase (KDO 8-P synthase)|nr:3-deoxy-8-phosphooctulonate synthase [Deltaproteobacteria bacterium]
MRIGEVPLGGGAPLVLITGLNVVETEAATLAAASRLAELAARHAFPMVFKASADKANRSSLRSFRGPGFDEALRVLGRVKAETGLPILTDVHEPAQAKSAAEVADCLQIPAFLCRQTDLIAASAATGRAINIKRGQFIAPEDLRLAVEKVEAAGTAEGVMVTERGSAFGYRDLVVDMRGLVQMREFAPVCYDATHSVQRPGAGLEASGGDRAMVLPLARAAIAVGIDALFVEVHPDPENAPCDGPSQIDFETFEQLLVEARALDTALASTQR